MAEVIDFPDATTVVIDHLAALLAEPVHSSVPSPRPDRFIVVERAGGPRSTIVTDKARIITTAWAEDDEAAAALCGAARSEILAMKGLQVDSGHQVYRVEDLSGPARDPDPDTGQDRYSTTQSVTVRGTGRAGS